MRKDADDGSGEIVSIFKSCRSAGALDVCTLSGPRNMTFSVLAKAGLRHDDITVNKSRQSIFTSSHQDGDERIMVTAMLLLPPSVASQ